MKPSTQPLRDLLESRQFWSAALFTFTLADGTVLRYCLGDADIVAHGATYSAGGATGPYFQQQSQYPEVVQRRGLDVSTMTFDALPGQATVYGVPFMTALWLGLFDGATFAYERAFMPTYGDTSVGTVLMFLGRVGDIEATRASATFHINSHLELLTQPFPRNLFQPGCVNTLYDASCGLNAAAYVTSGVAADGSTTKTIATNGGPPAGYLDLGKVIFTSGANAGVGRTIKSWDGSTISLIAPLPATPQPGDWFEIWPGCDKTRSRCQGVFNNIANFRGFPYVPAAETSI
jgi:uncharacterized phage protein (TIGR02218 family)